MGQDVWPAVFAGARLGSWAVDRRDEALSLGESDHMGARGE
jgi:hypothetical protein